MFVAALYALWISLAVRPEPAPRLARPRRLLLVLLAVVAARQAAWTADTLVLEARAPYYGSLAAAQDIQALGADRDICANGFHTVAVQPYFPANIFRNVQGDKAYFVWSWRSNYQRDRIDAAEYLLSGPWGLIPPRGYVLARLYPGVMPYKGRLAEEGTFALFRRAP